VSFFDYPDNSAGASRTSFAFLADASDDDWAAIRAHAELVHVRPGEAVIGEGDTDRALYIVVDGILEATVPQGRRGRERRVSTMEAGTVIGEVGFFDGQPRSAMVRAVTDAKLLRLGHDGFEFLAAKEPALGRAILFDLGRVLALRLRAVEALNRTNR
jgi:SulP family sulfate permease